MKKRYLLIVASMLLTALSCSSIRRSAVRMMADTLAGAGEGSTVFTGDNDPELIRDALPFTLKLYETLLQESPDHANLHLTTGGAFIMYAAAFIKDPASMLPESSYKKKKRMLVRAKKLFIRGSDYVLQGIELNHPGFIAALTKDQYDDAFRDMKKDDVPFLYWGGAGWIAAYSVDFFDLEMGTTVKRAIKMLQYALTLDDGYEGGALHEIFISYYGSIHAAMGGSEKLAREHYKKAVLYSKGLKASPYIALAETVSVTNQDLKEYRRLLNRALSVNPEREPRYRLVNIIARRRARWLLDHYSDRFLLPEK